MVKHAIKESKKFNLEYLLSKGPLNYHGKVKIDSQVFSIFKFC